MMVADHHKALENSTAHTKKQTRDQQRLESPSALLGNVWTLLWFTMASVLLFSTMVSTLAV